MLSKFRTQAKPALSQCSHAANCSQWVLLLFNQAERTHVREQESALPRLPCRTHSAQVWLWWESAFIVDDRPPLSLSLISFDLSFANANWKQIERVFLVVQLIEPLYMLHIFDVCVWMYVCSAYICIEVYPHSSTKSAGNVSFVSLLCYLLHPLHCSLQLPATATDATPTQRYPPSLQCRSLSISLSPTCLFVNSL